MILAASFFFLLLSFLSHHVGAASKFDFGFNFSDPSSYNLADLRLEGDATMKDNLWVDLDDCNDRNQFCSGRMSYNHPVPFYDNKTGEVASFVTKFSFAIAMAPNISQKGDGITFFLSGYPSRLPPGLASRVLGLTNSSQAIPSGGDRFLAVEFDTYSQNMGIVLNNQPTVFATNLQKDALYGIMNATISFDNTTRTLEALLTIDAETALDPARVSTQLPDQLDTLLPPNVSVGFSAASGGDADSYEVYGIRHWYFSSSMAARETPTDTPTGDTKVHPEQGRVIDTEETPPGASNFHPEQSKVLATIDRHGPALIIGGTVILVLALLLAIWSTMSWCRLQRIRNSFGKDSRLKRYKYRDLSMATDRFSPKKEIGKGGFGVVYRGSLKKKDVAVKKIVKDSRGEFKDFLAELAAIDGTGHVNLVRLEGWCCSIKNYMFWCVGRKNVELFLVYELVSNGNLHQHLYEKPEVLSWEMRYKIVKGLCSALHYLHHQCSQYILHRDIKPSNILLDKDFNPKLGDFGLSRVAENNDQTSLQTMAVGTTRYMDPLCMINGNVNFRCSSDVYSFGIVLLEIAHGEYNPNHIRKLHTDKPETFVEDVADRKLAGQFDKTEMEQVIVLGLLCSDPDDEKKRPSIIGAMKFLENGGELCPATPTHENEARTAATAAPA